MSGPVLEASLLDDARFLEELAKLEALPKEDTSVFPKPVPTVGNNQPSAITDELPPALGPRTKGPQFVLAPPPSKRRASSRSSSRSARVRTSVASGQPVEAPAFENLAAAASVSSTATSNEQGSTPAPEPVQQAEKNPETEAILSAFPSESARTAADEKFERSRVRESKRSASLPPALVVVGFVLMMSVGAGAAALVFHDRVTQIVHLLERSAARR